MGRDDDDLMKNENHSDDFEFDDSADDNLSIPDTPYGQDDHEGDDDLLGAVDEDFDLGEGLGDLGEDDEALDDLAGLDEETGHEQDDSVEGYGEEQEVEEEEGVEEPEPFKLGWKSYLGIGVAAASVVGGLAMVMFGGGSEPQRAPQAMSPEQLQQVAARNNPQQSPGSQAQSEGGNAGQQPMPAANSGYPNAPRVSEGGDQAYGNDFNNSTSDAPVITGPGRENPERGMTDERDILQIVEGEFAGLNDFKALRGTVNNQGRRIARIQDDLSDTKGSLTALEERVAKLEGSESNSEPKAQQGTTDDKAAEQKVKPSKEVREAQIRLKAFNYRPGPIDGLMGGRTEAAIKRFQKQHGIEVTGNLDKKTVSALTDSPEMFAGSYRTAPKQVTRSSTSKRADDRWYVRGVTSTRAIIYKPDGRSYAVSEGSEVPGFGQVTQLDPRKHKVVTTKGTIGLK